ncbi:hypothetical protein CBS147320_2809 [Aspergillus niger]|nr:hypothetical protein CBS11852_477 [Aspergillus niger]KAI2931016.1 hypothetical protein CBS147320_2809 [Aspergillus niger]
MRTLAIVGVGQVVSEVEEGELSLSIIRTSAKFCRSQKFVSKINHIRGFYFRLGTGNLENATIKPGEDEEYLPGEKRGAERAGQGQQQPDEPVVSSAESSPESLENKDPCCLRNAGGLSHSTSLYDFADELMQNMTCMDEDLSTSLDQQTLNMLKEVAIQKVQKLMVNNRSSSAFQSGGVQRYTGKALFRVFIASSEEPKSASRRLQCSSWKAHSQRKAF